MVGKRILVLSGGFEEKDTNKHTHMQPPERSDTTSETSMRGRKKTRPCTVFLKSASVSFFHILFFLFSFFYAFERERTTSFISNVWSAVAYEFTNASLCWLFIGLQFHRICINIYIYILDSRILYVGDFTAPRLLSLFHVFFLSYCSISFQLLVTFCTAIAKPLLQLTFNSNFWSMCVFAAISWCLLSLPYLSYKPLIPSTNTLPINVKLSNIYIYTHRLWWYIQLLRNRDLHFSAVSFILASAQCNGQIDIHSLF